MKKKFEAHFETIINLPDDIRSQLKWSNWIHSPISLKGRQLVWLPVGYPAAYPLLKRVLLTLGRSNFFHWSILFYLFIYLFFVLKYKTLDPPLFRWDFLCSKANRNKNIKISVSVSLRLFQWKQYSLQGCIRPLTPILADDSNTSERVKWSHEKLYYDKVRGDFEERPSRKHTFIILTLLDPTFI